ncbi:MAG: hypothetical protein HOW73_17200 [Polyangiaceae bacterium]|nr:hypothetical protein [Polyangiaceae bacterium]
MAATAQRASTATIDELSFNNDAVSMCLLVNRRHATVRVIDFRAGATLAKRNFVVNTARREGIEKVFVLVERDEVNTWARLGFRREGNIPSFYRRSDAWIMGAVVSAIGPMRPERAYDDDDDDDDGADEASPALDLADKAIDKARKLFKDTADKAVPPTKVAIEKRDAAFKAVAVAQKAGRALTGFESFSRDAERHHLVLSGKSGFELHASYEVQPSFASSMIELLTAPRDESERMLTVSALRSIVGVLNENGAISGFSVAPADDILLGSCFLANGFRKSAVLASHLIVGGKRRDAIVWSKKLADN